MSKLLIRDPADASRDGYHSIDDYNGNERDSLNGNIKMVFLTGIPITHLTSAVRQPNDWTCGPYALAQALGLTDGNPVTLWLLQHGLIDSDQGTEHQGIGAYLQTQGITTSWDGRYYNGQMHTAIYDRLVNHIRSGFKAILLMGGLKSKAGGMCRNSYWSNAGHYVCCYGIDEASEDIAVDGLWGPGTTRKAQAVFGLKADGIVSNQNKDMQIRLQNCQTASWEFVPASKLKGGSALIHAIQHMLKIKEDGFCGMQTVLAMQKFLGVTADGLFGGKSVTAFQRWLNQQ